MCWVVSELDDSGVYPGTNLLSPVPSSVTLTTNASLFSSKFSDDDDDRGTTISSSKKNKIFKALVTHNTTDVKVVFDVFC